MAASVDAAAAVAPPVVHPAADEAGDAVEQARTLIGALNLLSRNLPLPPDVLRAVSSIYHDGGAGDAEEDEEEGEGLVEKEGDEEMAVADAAEEGSTEGAVDGAAEVRAGDSSGATLIEELEDAMFKNQRMPISYSELAALKEGRFNASIQHRLAELEGLPSTRGEDLQMKCLLELYGLKLLDLQKKVRSDISAEYWLHKKCAYPERQLFDWGMMRIQYPFAMYGIGDSFLMDADDVHRKKRFTERMSRLEEEEKIQADIRKRKFFTEILNAYREHQVQLATTFKQRKQRNDGVQAWHLRARQRISRQEKSRLNLLKIGDQEAYMRMVEESKNERLKMLLDKTNELLEGIGKAVQRQKDAEHVSQPEGVDVPKGSESDDYSQISDAKNESPGESPSDDDADIPGSADESKFNAGRRLDFTVHSIEEKVLRPFLLRRKKDEVEKYLPVKTQVILKCDMSAWQKAYYEQVTSRERVALGSGLRSKALQNLSMQLRKCCNHPYLFVEHYNMYQREEIVRASGKFELLDRLLPKLQRAGHRVLLFSQMTKLLDVLEIYLQMYNFKYMRLDGSTKTEERGRLLADFNKKDSEYFMFLLSTRAGGLGLNLQTADTVIIFDSDWNPQMDQQAEDRAHRIGQKNEVRVFVLVSVGSIEEEILDRAKQKMGIDAKVIQAGLFNTTSTAQDRRALLQEILRRGTSSLGTDIPSEREINRLAARNDEEFWLFEKMDEERRQRENYKSRLMDGNEVPDWVFANNNEPVKRTVADEFENISVGSKRRRKEVVYSDSFGDQWMKSDEGFDEVRKITSRAKRSSYLSDIQEEVDFSERRKRPRSLENSADGASNPSWTPDKGRAGISSYSKDETEEDGEDEVITSGLQKGNSFTWNTLGRKRSNHFNSGRPSF
nr:unnamed protein product [Digitaria exilis]